MIRPVTEYEQMVERPGKFEGGNRYVPYFWELSMEGYGDINSNTISLAVTPEDKQLFPELRKRKVIKLLETNDGFVEEIRR